MYSMCSIQTFVFLFTFLSSILSANGQSCTTPSSITGYGNAGATETALTMTGFTVTGYTCASGYSGTAAASVCTGGAGSAYVLSGCTATCVAPSLSTGYNGGSKSETTLTISGFAVTGWTCANGYSGTASATACFNAGAAYVLAGCTPILCVRPTNTLGKKKRMFRLLIHISVFVV